MIKNLQKTLLRIKLRTGKVKKNSGGFVMLFAVTLSAILLSIALGISNIAFREVRFSTNARDTNDAFFAADTGAENALFRDKTGTAIPEVFPIFNLGSTNQGCVKVTVIKNSPPVIPATTIISKGYNKTIGNCDPSSNIVERQIEVNY
ncbi:hypothetical protein HYW72_00935 [Candidatus Nomurabacteria bacterium]|nr:hypothetical protein [Candidatus Nomurabacteria bacterium]